MLQKVWERRRHERFKNPANHLTLIPCFVPTRSRCREKNVIQDPLVFIRRRFYHTPNQWSGRTGSWLQMNWLSLRNNRLKFKTAEKLSIILEEFVEYTPNLIKENRRMWTCNRSDLQSLGSQPVVMPKNIPYHASQWWVLESEFHDLGQKNANVSWGLNEKIKREMSARIGPDLKPHIHKPIPCIA